VDEFKAALRQSTLRADFADGDGDEDADPDSLDDLYTSVITSIADRLALADRTSDDYYRTKLFRPDQRILRFTGGF